MNLSKNSWYNWIYKFIYGFDIKLPNNLCPYFWKLLCAFVLFIPIFLFELPMITFEFILSKFKKPKKYWYKDGVFSFLNGNSFFSAIVFNYIFYIIFCMIAMWFNLSNTILRSGILGYFIVIITVTVIFIINTFEKRSLKSEYKPQKEKKPNIIKEFIKAKYNRYCPKINWK